MPAGGVPATLASGAVPSPKSRLHEVMVPSGSLLADPSKLTGSGAAPDPGAHRELGRAGGVTATTIWAVAVLVRSFESVTLSLAV